MSCDSSAFFFRPPDRESLWPNQRRFVCIVHRAYLESGLKLP